MNLSHRLWWVLPAAPAAIVFAASAVGVSAQSPAAPLDVLLSRAAAYLDTYGKGVSGIVGQETYLQEVQNMTATNDMPGIPYSQRQRRLVSDFSFLADPREGWIEFRDVQTVNGQAVGQQKTVIALLSEPSPSALVQARRLVELGSRFNLVVPAAVVDRTINLPMSGMLFLKAAHQKRSSFTIGRSERIDGVNTVVLQFQETATPRLIASDAGQPASGQFWIEPETGRVLQSELRLTTGTRSRQTRATIRVRYARNDRLDLTLPAWMTEEYETATSSDPLIVGCRADYGSYRRFGVAVEESFRPTRE